MEDNTGILKEIHISRLVSLRFLCLFTPKSSRFHGFTIFEVDWYDALLDALPVRSISLNIDRAAVIVVCNREIANLVTDLEPMVAGSRY